jgi:ATP-dependent helicase HepA
MQDFTIGQRWVSAGELQLGIGMVIEVEHRTVSIIFPATGEVRVYAKQTAPLSRVSFSEGDVIRDQDDRELRVVSVEENRGLRVYRCVDAEGTELRLPEGKLSNFLQLNQPLQRLLNGQIDYNKWFELRARTRKIASLLAGSDLQGLTGCRTSLIDHQLYIAHEVANRHAPRVLLADEVGLGKTIEAGLILHQQLLTERAHRVLIVVPESLQHQWLLEMMRRFNLMFSIFDERRCAAIDAEHADSDGLENPFHTEQLVLCSLEFLREHPGRHAQALAGEWDMLIVDEAHHLVWDEQRPSVEYRMIEQLAQITPSVLLLTATPEQLGKASHFARLRLLDPDRFSDLARFIEEETHYREIADLVEALLRHQPLDEAQQKLLESTLVEGDNRTWLERIDDADPDVAEAAREHLVDHLLDRHGVGRVLFRNTRHAVQGFPGRELHAALLPCPDIYRELYEELALDADGEADDPQWLLSPEIVLKALSGESDRWTGIDPRVGWLTDFLRAHRDDKVLVICSSAHTALDLAAVLKRDHGLPVGAFHEGLSLIERDRAAAWFADREQGAQALICSEIGSEGRNFQFAHQLVLFDLPWNPDLLEQRIGRLDRIGQLETIRIHVPCLSNTAQQVMMTWLHEALDAFEQTCPAGHSVFAQQREELLQALRQPQQDHEAFIRRSAELHRRLNDQMQQGRDRLLE